MSELEEELSQTQAAAADTLKQSEHALREETESHRSSQERIAKLEKQCAELNQQCDRLSGRSEQLQEELAAAEENARAAVAEQKAPERLREAEQLLRDRTEELDNLRWRLEQTEAQAAAKVDENVVMVLNQQLADAQEENQRLREKIDALAATEADAADDLTDLKGIGGKLAEQLAEIGISHLSQIAELDARELDDTSHPLHGFKHRILRDDWIKQAKAALERKR
jgi:predicted flap endonuclease-1-like 5' DNA nuclease